jgi:hypothetical protein
MYPLTTQPEPPEFDHNKQAYAASIALFILIAVFLLVFFTGCNTEKRIIKKDNTAIERVTAKRSLLDKIAPVIQGIYPCANDTFFSHTKDTLISHDTAISYIHSSDTVNKVRIDTLKVKISTTKVIHDTAVVVDRQVQKIDAKTIEAQGLTIAGLNQNIIDLESTIKAKSKQNTLLIVIISIAIALFILSLRARFMNWIANLKI